MTQEERLILSDENRKKLTLNYKQKYSDDFYNTYLSNFHVSVKRRVVFNVVKRLFDFLVSLFSLLLLLIPFLIIGIIIKIDSKGPVFFLSRRIGKNGKSFNCLKFRSMVLSAPPDKATSVFTNAQSYVTRVGHFLRKTSIDELPQLINVLLGQMSIIGYRPLVLSEINCNGMRKEMGVFQMRPGITGLAQVSGRDDVYYKNKAIFDAYYVQNAGICLDLCILFKTILMVSSGKGNQDN